MLFSLTAMEEEAIQKVTPLISIICFSHGNIGSEVNTACVWKKSKLNAKIPNIPSECNFIIIRRHQINPNKSDSGLRSTKFLRCKIQRLLELLSQAISGVRKPTQTFQLQISN